MNAEIAPDLNECVFYHSMDLPGLGTVEGQWDLRGRFDEYIGGIDVNGKTFLDVGAASGFLSFEAERRGASVISFDALDYTPTPARTCRRSLTSISSSGCLPAMTSPIECFNRKRAESVAISMRFPHSWKSAMSFLLAKFWFISVIRSRRSNKPRYAVRIISLSRKEASRPTFPLRSSSERKFRTRGGQYHLRPIVSGLKS